MKATNERFGIVFDTNVYREMTFGKTIGAAKSYFRALRDKEAELGYQAFAHPLVMLELLANLADPKKPNYEYQKSAVSALSEHCFLRNDLDRRIAIIADGESQLCESLYRCHPEEYEMGMENLARLCKQVCESEDNNLLANFRPIFMKLADAVAVKEQHFVEDMRQFVVKALDPNATDWNPLKGDILRRRKILEYVNSDYYLKLMAMCQVFKAQSLLGIQESNKEVANKADFVIKLFKAPLKLYLEILNRIIATGCNVEKPKRRNWIWDIQIAFCVGRGHLADNRRIILVTRDKDIVAAAKAAGCSELVMTIQEYLNVLDKICKNDVCK